MNDIDTGIFDEKVNAYTHKQLIAKAKNWLIGTKNCSIALTELVTTNITEIPDALGFYGKGATILLEVKVSKSDFLRDKTKSFRIYEEEGIGDYRYYYTPKGLLQIEELPEGWGLIEFNGYQSKIKKEAEYKTANKTNEVALLVSTIRRLQMSTCVYVVAENTKEIE